MNINDYIRGHIVTDFICRPVMFMTSADQYLLNNGCDGAGGFEAIGSIHDLPPNDESTNFIMEKGDKTLSMKYLLSYDEMQLSAYFSVAVPTYFINAGSRGNCGKLNIRTEEYQRSGVYVASVGARFEKKGLMDWEHMMVTETQNTVANGFGANSNNHRSKLLRMWAKFYYEGTNAYNFGASEPILPTFDECFDMREFRNAEWEERYLDITAPHGMCETYLDKFIYKRRMKFIAESFLLEANERARAASSPIEQIQAYVHVVGLGLGVWQVHTIQGSLLVEAYAEVLRETRLEYVSDIDFSWIHHTDCGGAVDGALFPSTKAGNDITIHFSRRDPADPVPAGKLLVAQYAWDSNSYPGNEYWIGALSASGDPAAACCSLIGELQNPYIHPEAFTMDRFRTWPDGETLSDEPSTIEPSRGSLCNEDYPMPLEAQYGGDDQRCESFDEYKTLNHSVVSDGGIGDGADDCECSPATRYDAEEKADEVEVNMAPATEEDQAMEEETARSDGEDGVKCDKSSQNQNKCESADKEKELCGQHEVEDKHNKAESDLSCEIQVTTSEATSSEVPREKDAAFNESLCDETCKQDPSLLYVSAETVPTDIEKLVQTTKENVQLFAAKRRAESNPDLDDGKCDDKSDSSCK